MRRPARHRKHTTEDKGRGRDVASVNDEEKLDGAIGAVRVGSTVRKVSGPWTATVHALLRFLLDAGFNLAPEPQGFDERGREVLSWVDGTPGDRPWPAALLSDEGVAELADVLRRYHDVVRLFDPGSEATWRAGRRRVRDGEIVCHGDFGPWNTLWRDEHVVGIIDWDMAEPDQPIMDVAFLALHVVPLRSDANASKAGFGSVPPRRERLRVLCEAYGDVRPTEVLDAVASWHRRDRHRTTTWGAEGRQPWSTFLRRGDLRLIDDDESWLNTYGHALA
jgi:hypothetical protein